MELYEGLREGDLEDLVLPLLSIDEYESKIDDDAIVVGFYVQDREPANDLNRFIQKSAISLLDTDVSPAPNEDGYYLVFVELLRDHSFPQKLLDILENVEGLCLVDEWQAQIVDQEGVFPVDEKTLTVMVRMDPVKDEVKALEDDDDLSESLRKFFRPSILDDFVYNNGGIVLERRGAKLEAILVDFGDPEQVVEDNVVLRQHVRLDEAAQRTVRRLQAFLGVHWLVESFDQYVVLSHDGSPDIALLRLI